MSADVAMLAVMAATGLVIMAAAAVRWWAGDTEVAAWQGIGALFMVLFAAANWGAK